MNEHHVTGQLTETQPPAQTHQATTTITTTRTTDQTAGRLINIENKRTQEAGCIGRNSANVRVQIARHAIINVKSARFATFNIRSMNNKVDDVYNLMKDYELDVMALTESWHEDSDCVPIRRLRCMDFKVVEAARPKIQKKQNSVNYVNHGGVVLVSKKGLALSQIPLKLKITTFEYLCVKIYSKGSSQILLVVYRPGSALPSNLFFDKFSALLGMVTTFELPVTIAGDINIHFVSTSNTDTSKFMEVLHAFGKNQFVSSSTHRLGGILDAVIASIHSPLQNISIIDVSLSDHKLVHWTVPWKTFAINYKTIEHRTWKHFKTEDFVSELQTSSICLSDINPNDTKTVDDLVAQFNSTILTLLDKHAPKQQFKVRQCNHMPWFDEESRLLQRHVCQLERQYRKDGNDQNRDAWKVKLRQSRNMSKTKAVEYWKNKITSAGPDARRVWRCMDTLLGREKVADDQTSSAQTYHDFMDDKISQIRASTASVHDPIYTVVASQKSRLSKQFWRPTYYPSSWNHQTNSVTSTISQHGC